MRESVIRTVAISIIYALIESNYIDMNKAGDFFSTYHILVYLIGIVTGFDKSVRTWTANFLLYSVLEDLLYWAFKFQLPSQWSPEYIVIWHIPVYYIPYSVLALLLYTSKLKLEKFSKFTKLFSALNYKIKSEQECPT